MNFQWDWSFALESTPVLLQGLGVTVAATISGMLLAIVLGLIWALMRRSHLIAVRWFAGGLVEFVRSSPLVVQLYFLYYSLPNYGISMSAFLTGFLGLGLHYSAYTAEVYRAGLESVDQGQRDACRALSLPPRIAFLRIILPQALRPVVPALGNYLIAMFKDAPMLSAITVAGVLFAAKNLGSDHFRYLEPMTLVGIFFILISLAASRLIGRLESSLNRTVS